MKTALGRGVTLLAAILAVAGCGGGSGDSILAGGGIGGTGIGTVTGFGSIIFNDDTKLDIAPDSEVRVDGQEVEQSLLFGAADCSGADPLCGLVGRFDARADFGDDSQNPGFKRGTAERIELEHHVKGPITRIDPLEALGQPLVITGETVLAGGVNSGGSNLVVGDLVEVSGLVDGAIQVTRLERKGNLGDANASNALPEWKIIGRVTDVTATVGLFDVNGQRVSVSQFTDCPGGLQVGDLVEVKADFDGSFATNPGRTLAATTVECREEGLKIPAGVSGSLEAEVEGIVNDVSQFDPLAGTGVFLVHGQEVRVYTTTSFEGGTPQDIVTGAKVEVEGALDTTSGELQADKIEFDEQRVSLTAMVDDVTGGLGSQFTTDLGVTVRTTALTEDEDGLLDGSGNHSGMQRLEIKGYLDGNDIVATEVKLAGGGGGQSEVRGPASNIDAGNYRFEILGVTVFVPDTADLDPWADRNDLFNELDGNSELVLEVEGSFSAGVLTAEEVERED